MLAGENPNLIDKFPSSKQGSLILILSQEHQLQTHDGLENHEQRTHSAKMGDDGLAKYTPSISKTFRPICPIGPKVLDIVEKRLHWASVVHGQEGIRKFSWICHICFLVFCFKGQLILKCPFGVFKSTKNQQIFCKRP